MPTQYLKFTEEMQDGRRKLSTPQREEILEAYKSGKETWQSLATRYNVSKRTIGFIVNPETKKRISERNKTEWKKYFNRAKLTEATRKMRAKKRLLGLIKRGV